MLRNHSEYLFTGAWTWFTPCNTDIKQFSEIVLIHSSILSFSSNRVCKDAYRIFHFQTDNKIMLIFMFSFGFSALCTAPNAFICRKKWALTIFFISFWTQLYILFFQKWPILIFCFLLPFLILLREQFTSYFTVTCFFLLLDSRAIGNPLESVSSSYASVSRGSNDGASVVRTSTLSASAPEFVPFGMGTYEVRETFTPHL